MARALIVGIDQYDNDLRPLTGCVNDAKAMKEVLECHEDGGKNFHCRLLINSDKYKITRKLLREQWSELFDNYYEDTLFYFSGHGHPTAVGGYIVTQDAEPGDPGLNMNELLTLANKSRAKSVLLILDCCFAGGLGDPTILQGSGGVENIALLREGLTILAASRPMQTAALVGKYSLFTNLVVGALRGGAADVRGHVSAAAIYAYVEQALDSWDQRAVYKSHAYMLNPVRRCKPYVSDALLRELPKIFDEFDDKYRLDSSYEFTEPTANPEHVALFNKFKTLRNARLLATEGDKDLYYVALESLTIELTPLGQYYWQLANVKGI
jgi:uncharacterized caspase-like protein